MKIKHLFLSLILILTFSCGTKEDSGGGGTTSGNPSINMQFAPYNSIAFYEQLRNFFFIPSAYASVSSLKFCFKRLRLKTSNSDAGDDVELELGKRTISSGGTELGNVKVPAGKYERIEFDLEKECEDSNDGSVELVNDNGTFHTDDRMTIKFEGEFDTDDDDLIMDVQVFINALENVNNEEDIKAELENLSGDF